MLAMIHQAEHRGKIAGLKSIISEEDLIDLSEDVMKGIRSDLEKYLNKIEDNLDKVFDVACVIYARKKLAYQKI